MEEFLNRTCFVGATCVFVDEFLPLKSKSGNTAVVAYDVVVRNRQSVPPKYLPFAVDEDSRFFFVDCSDPVSPVYIRIADFGLTPLNVGFDAFWASLKYEE